MREILVRHATEQDAAAINSIVDSAVATLRETYWPTARAIAGKQAVESSLGRLVAEWDRRPVGYVEYCIEEDGVDFLTLAVQRGCRRRGVGRQIVCELERLALVAGRRRLCAYTVKEAGIVDFFQRLGFRVVSECPTDLFVSDQFDTLTEVHLEKLVG